MKGLRKLVTIIIVLAVLFVFRIAWIELSELGISSSLLMQTGINQVSTDLDKRANSQFSLDLQSNQYRNGKQGVLQTKANVENQKLDESLSLLRNTAPGIDIAKNLDKAQIKIIFGQPKTAGAAAVFVPNFIGNSGKIIVSDRLRDEEPSVVAAILAHEAMHAKMNTPLGYNSVQQEYRCYVAQAKVWEDVRPALSLNVAGIESEIADSSPENDYAIEIKEMSKIKAFQQIWKDYKQIGIDLPLE